MSGTITGELRLFLADPYREWMTQEKKEQELKDALDAIDAVHANLERENASLKAELDRVLGEQDDRDGWVELPKDADGERVYVGDVMEWCDGDHDTFEVIGIGDDVLFYFDPDADDEVVEWTSPTNKRHHRTPTVEDVLREFGRGWHEQMNGPETFDVADYVERYAAKLRLAGDAS